VIPIAAGARWSFLLLGLWLAALALALHGLGNVPLRDWDEAIVARVSLEISRSSGPDLLLPTYLGSEYLNKPPGMHLAIAAAIHAWRELTGAAQRDLPPEWVVRLVPAVGSSLLVPLLALVQARLRPARPGDALATGLIALTLMPLARHGRLAMLDGTQLTAMVVVWLGFLVVRPAPRAALAGGLIAGTGVSLLLLLKAPVALPVLAGALILRALDRDLDRSAWVLACCALALGLVPGLGWHLWHGLARGPEALVMWGSQGMARLFTSVENHAGGPVVPLTQVLVGGWPWLPLWPFGLRLAWRERATRSGRWTLGLSLLCAAMVLPLRTQLPWYSLLLWPPFALACGPVLASLGTAPLRSRAARLLPKIWLLLGGLLVVAAAGLLIASLLGVARSALGWLVLPAGVGLVAAGGLLPRLRRRGGRVLAVSLLAGGWYASLLLLFSTPLWNWELNETPSIAPLRALADVRGTARASLPRIVANAEDLRPSLVWYLDPISRDSVPSTERVVPGDYTVIGRSLPGGEATCRLEESGDEGWKRWHCRSARVPG
jgi:4-amino-4-deoxy-L-arabinose transferase-like glycosyltransferase